MKTHYRSYFLEFLTLAASAVTLYFSYSRKSYWILVAGSSAAIFLIFNKLLDRSMLKISFNKKHKAIRDLVETLSVFGIISSGLLAGLATGTVPAELVVAVYVLSSTAPIFQLKVSSRFRKAYRFSLGESYWILTVAATLTLAHFNSYFLFYGYGFLVLIILFDLIELSKRIETQY